MGGAWSYAPTPSDMRLASREVCDDETWANTVLNRSSIGVQERLYELESEAAFSWGGVFGEDWSSSESEDELTPRKRRRKRLEFAEVDVICEFVVERGEEEAGFVMEFDAW